MASDTVYVGQLICDSTTPPPDRGFYKINDTTTGHVGKLVMSDPVSGKESVALTATYSDGVVDKFAFARQVGATAVVRSSEADSIGAAGTSSQKLDSVKIPAGALKSGDTLRFTLGLLKSGASDTATFKICAGTTDTSSDSAIITPVLATSAATYGAIHAFKATSSTSLRQVGVNSGNNSLPGTSANAPAASIIVGDFSASDIYIGLYCTMSIGSEFPTIRSFIVEFIPKV